ncbi:dienelactone hydrolase family protein [Aquisphaera insulae]|uniref:dienelactone hydrolase family protein n=1 Tax=Aquisphaera insulae TaxID=2712864 RepID=UPI0013EC6612|nr:dienelactone hydrolase family protein [Aquisphaera insulae]
MVISFECPRCAKRYSTSLEWAGRRVKCSRCGERVQVPMPPADETPDDQGTASPGWWEEDDSPVAAARSGRPAGAGASSPAGARSPAAGRISSERSWDLPRNLRMLLGIAGILVILGAQVYPLYRSHRKDQERQRALAAKYSARKGRILPRKTVPEGLDLTDWTLPSFGEPTAAVDIEPGILFREIPILTPPGEAEPRPGHRGKLWLYLPGGEHAPHSLPCVLITGAGSKLIAGMDLHESARAEHLPYARAGMAVLAYELDGMLTEAAEADVKLTVKACSDFLRAQAGLINAHNAIQYAIRHVPTIDPERLFVAGHSSAGTLALLVAENEPRVAACAAYAPATALPEHIPLNAMEMLTPVIDGIADLYGRFNPSQHDDNLTCPIFLFYAEDDARFASKVRAFGERLRAKKKDVSISSVPAGGHYESMIDEGMPRAIEWLKSLPRRDHQPNTHP